MAGGKGEGLLCASPSGGPSGKPCVDEPLGVAGWGVVAGGARQSWCTASLRMEMEPPGLAGFSKVTASAFRA